MNVTWGGMVAQHDGLEYPVAMTIKESEIEVQYPTLGCGGVLRPLAFREGTLRAREHIVYGSGCVEGVEVFLRHTVARELDAEFFVRGRLVARGRMVRSPGFPGG